MAQRTTKKRPTQTPKKASARERYRGTHFWLGLLWMVVGVILLAYLIYGVVLYFAGWTGGGARAVTSFFFYPAASVLVPGYVGYYLLSLLMLFLLVASVVKLGYLAITDRLGLNGKTVATGFIFLAAVAALVSVPRVTDSVVSYHEYLARVNAFGKLEKAQNQQATQSGQPTAPTTPTDVKESRALTQLLSNNVVRQEATKFNVKVSNKDVNDLYKQYADQAQGESNLKKRLNDVLGWSPSTFKRELKVQLLKQRLQEKLQTDDKINKDAKKKADNFLKKAKSGQDFAALAKQSDDPTAQAGGNQGFVKKGELDPVVEAAAFSLKPGEISKVLKTANGYVIIKVEDRHGDTEVKLSQILVKTTSLADFIPDQLKKTKVSVYVKGLIWDKNLNAVQPKSQPKGQASAAPTATPAAKK